LGGRNAPDRARIDTGEPGENYLSGYPNLDT